MKDEYGETEYYIDKNEIIGKTILVGIRCYNSQDQLVDDFEIHGIIRDQVNDLIEIDKGTDKYFYVPKTPIIKAKPGIYRERSTGIEIEDPDFVSQWRVENINDIESVNRIRSNGFFEYEKKEE